MAKVPEFITSDDYHFGTVMDTRVLPKGSFVKPIDLYYVPKHCFKYPGANFYNENRDVFVYCRFGILPIPKKLILEVKW